MVIQKRLCQFYILLTKVNKILAVSACLLLGAMELLGVSCHAFDVLLCFQSISHMLIFYKSFHTSNDLLSFKRAFNL